MIEGLHIIPQGPKRKTEARGWNKGINKSTQEYRGGPLFFTTTGSLELDIL